MTEKKAYNLGPRELDDADRRQLDEFRKSFDDAMDRGDVDAMRQIFNDKTYRALNAKEAGALARDFVAEAFSTLATSAAAQAVLAATMTTVMRDLRTDYEWKYLTFVRVKALEAHVAELEARPALKYVGTWSSERQCNEGELVTHDGSIFYCKQTTRDRPGTSSAFQLAVKRGRDGRDAR